MKSLLMVGSSQYACVCNCDNQLLTLTKDSSCVKSNINKKPMASRKKAVVKLRNLKKY